MVKTVLIILDGAGANPSQEGNAIAKARTPNLDFLWSNFPHTLLKAAEEEVGLSFGQVGNSEVGHMAIGCGRVIPSAYQRINISIQDGSFFKNPVFLQAMQKVKEKKSKLHLVGMISQAGVHGDLNHILALLKLAKAQGVTNVYIHPILDGRDTGPREAKAYLGMLDVGIKKEGIGIVASIGGRAYAMDRNNNWERTQKYYEALIGTSALKANTAIDAVEQAYHDGLDDEMLLPTIVNMDGRIQSGDVVIVTNFREDRARQLARILTSMKDISIVTMTEYEKSLPVSVAFPTILVTNTLSDVFHQNNIPQLHIAETEKYAHTTYFFNGGRETPYLDEEYANIQSDSPEKFLTNPAMQALKIADFVVNDLESNKHQFIVLNFANPDMIGHTGDLEKTVQAIEAVDTAVGKISQKIFSQNGLLFLTADHGNSEQKIDLKTGQVSKDHTINPVPFLMAGNNLKTPGEIHKFTFGSMVTGILQDVTPTILKALNLPQPTEMIGTPMF